MKGRPRIWLTAGGERGWSRQPGQTYDPADDPTAVDNLLRGAFVTKTRTLEPADLIERAERLGATSRPANAGKTMIYPPDKTQSPVCIAPRFGNGSDRQNAIGNLRKAGLDVINDPRLNGTAVVGQAPTPADVAKMHTGGGRPKLQYEKPEPEPQPVRDTEDMLELIDGLETRVGELTRQLVDQDRRMGVVEESNQKLIRRVEFLERAARAEGGAESRAVKYERIGGLVMDLLRRMPAAIPLTMGQIADGSQLSEEDRQSLRTSVARLIEAGKVTSHGKGSGMTYSAAPEE